MTYAYKGLILQCEPILRIRGVHLSGLIVLPVGLVWRWQHVDDASHVAFVCHTVFADGSQARSWFGARDWPRRVVLEIITGHTVITVRATERVYAVCADRARATVTCWAQ